jgi:hypothetical protein
MSRKPKPALCGIQPYDIYIETEKARRDMNDAERRGNKVVATESTERQDVRDKVGDTTRSAQETSRQITPEACEK